jgi:hypothetical protein
MMHVTLAISDVLGSLDLLASQGRVHEVDHGGLTAFAAS